MIAHRATVFGVVRYFKTKRFLDAISIASIDAH